MRKTNSKETARDWAYSDQFLPHAKRIIGEYLTVAAPLEIDCREATDLIYIVSGRGDVAFRVRRPKYAIDYPYDVTFRVMRDGFNETELDKILNGNALWMLYGFGAEDGQTIARWFLLNLNAFRAALLRGQLKRSHMHPNGDGTGFEIFDVRILRGIDPAIVFAASEEIPADVLPVARRETARDFWRAKISGEK
jgi:hypothetical protein